MIARRGMVAGAALMLGACAVTMPPEYLGIATRAPLHAEDRARIEAAAASDAQPRDGCPWPSDGGSTLAHVPCALLPPSQLAGLAWSGNKPAALELGKRFEAGRGVPQDFAKALSLYAMAANTTGGDLWIYSPGVGDQLGQVVPLFLPEEPGPPQAARRRALLEAWRERQESPGAQACPAPPIALATIAARPEPAEERARLDKAIAEGRLGRGRCLWQKGEKTLTTIPCEVVPLPTLARMAEAGDRRAMLELGIRFERGRGTAASPAQAEALYCAAGQTRITAGGPGPDGSGWREIEGELGLPDARRRWQRLRKASGMPAR